MKQPIQGQQKSIRNSRPLYKNDTDKTEALRLSEDVELDSYHSPKKGFTPMTNVLAGIGSKDSFGDAAFNKKNLGNLRSSNFRYNRFYKPVNKKSRATNRSTVLKRGKDNIKQPIVQNKSIKQAKRYGSVPKNLNNSFPSIKNPTSQNSSGVFNYPQEESNSKISKKNMNVYKQNTAAKLAAAQYSAVGNAGPNLNYLERSMSPMMNSQPEEFYDQQTRITSYENIKQRDLRQGVMTNDQRMLVKRFKDTNGSSNGTMNKSTLSANQMKCQSLNTLYNR